MDQSDLCGTGVDSAPHKQVLRLAKMAHHCGMSGMVSSAEEVISLRSEMGDAPFLVVPGIRPAGAPAGDQRRVATPTSAIRDGASMLVVGRPITQAIDPGQAAEAILLEIRQALQVAHPELPTNE